ncbi:MAG TPA: ferritin-like domain-containing protein [Candidatus Acidoferrales bacterium]|nr:ferritin-like domain-containing protein [Candidatus Acidoferrales bacterium]
MKQNTLKELYVNELRDLYDAEQQLVKALPKMAKTSNSSKLRNGFEEHLEQTKEHVKRLEQILNSLGEAAKGKKCKGLRGIVAEGSEVLGEDYDGDVKDAALISAAQRVEHYEIAAYGTVHAFAELLGENEASSLLKQTLTEEKETDEKLTQLSQDINPQALKSGFGVVGDERMKPLHKTAKAGSTR